MFIINFTSLPAMCGSECVCAKFSQDQNYKKSSFTIKNSSLIDKLIAIE